jgi:hypothetical protein
MSVFCGLMFDHIDIVIFQLTLEVSGAETIDEISRHVIAINNKFQ